MIISIKKKNKIGLHRQKRLQLTGLGLTVYMIQLFLFYFMILFVFYILSLEEK